LVLVIISWRWLPLLTITLNEDLAFANGIKPQREKLFLTLSLGITVAFAIKIVGVLLIVAMLIIPAAAAKTLARSPEIMAVIASIIGGLSTVLGLRVAYTLDTPAGPTIVCVAAVFFITLNCIGYFQKYN
jgi:zinc transport system permease protein